MITKAFTLYSSVVSGFEEDLLIYALLCCSYKTAEKLFLDAMDKIKAIGNEVTILLLLLSSCFSACFWSE